MYYKVADDCITILLRRQTQYIFFYVLGQSKPTDDFKIFFNLSKLYVIYVKLLVVASLFLCDILHHKIGKMSHSKFGILFYLTSVIEMFQNAVCMFFNT